MYNLYLAKECDELHMVSYSKTFVFLDNWNI